MNLRKPCIQPNNNTVKWLSASTRAEADLKACFRQEKGNNSLMFDKLKSGFKGLINKVTTTELKTENLYPILSEFKMSLAENDVAFPVADKICDELEKRLAGLQVKRLEDRKKIVEDNLRQAVSYTHLR